MTLAGVAPPAARCAPPAPTATTAAAPAPASTVVHVTRSAGAAPAPPVSRGTPVTKVEQQQTHVQCAVSIF